MKTLYDSDGITLLFGEAAAYEGPCSVLCTDTPYVDSEERYQQFFSETQQVLTGLLSQNPAAIGIDYGIVNTQGRMRYWDAWPLAQRIPVHIGQREGMALVFGTYVPLPCGTLHILPVASPQKSIQKPVQLVRQLLQYTTGPILDPFCGTGTTLVAAAALGRTAVGIERNERRADLALRRLNDL